MLGNPEKHLLDSMNNHLNKMDSVKGVHIVSKKISEPKLDEKSQLFMCFSEVEIECSDLVTLTTIIINFLPSSVEIVDPAELRMSCKDATDYLTELVMKLHSYDGIIRELDMRLKSSIKIMTDNGLIKDGKLTEEAKSKIKK